MSDDAVDGADSANRDGLPQAATGLRLCNENGYGIFFPTYWAMSAAVFNWSNGSPQLGSMT
jgi:hypothetical protein